MKSALILSQEALQVFETLPDLYVILSPALLILTASDAYLAQVFKDRAALVGKSPFEAFPGPAGTAEGDTMRNLSASLRRVLATRKTHRMTPQRYDLQQPGGNRLTRYWQPLNTPVLDAQGEIRYIIHKVEDCTERVTWEQRAEYLGGEARRQGQKARQLVDTFRAAFIELDFQERYRFVNRTAEEYLGKQREELLGKGMWEVFPQAKGSSVYHAIQKALTERKKTETECFSVVFNRWVFLSAVPSDEGVMLLCYDRHDIREARQQLAWEHARLKQAESIGHLGSFTWDAATNRVYWSDQHYRMHGLEPGREEVTVEKIFGLIHPQDRKMFIETFRRLRSTATAGSLVHRIIRADGAVRHLNLHYQSFAGEGGKVTHASGTAHDVTERQSAAESLRNAYHQLARSNGTIRRMLDGSIAAICLLDAARDEGGNIIDFIFRGANVTAEQINRKTEAELAGRGLLEMFPGVKEVFFDEYVRVVETGEPLRTERYYRFEHYDQCFDVSAVKNEDGFILTFLDITERKKAEEEVNKNLTLLRQSETLARMGSWEYDLATGAFTWSEGMYRLFGLPAGSPVRPGIYLDSVLAEDRPLAETFIAKVQQGRAPLAETLRIGVPGAVLTLKMKAVPLRNGQGRPVKVLGVDLDISEVKRLEAENLHMRLDQQTHLLNVILEAQEEERRRISEALHNGVGQILFATKLHLSRVEMAFGSGQAQGVQEGLAATEALLTEAIHETRRASHELVPVLLKEYGLDAAIADFCARFPGTGVAFASHGMRERLAAPLETAIYRITQELANNIVKHAHATRARIELTRNNDTVRIEAHDNGQGMDAANPGTGIGLKTIHDRVKLLDGKVAVKSAPGKGTLITVVLPLSRTPEPQ